MLIIDANVVFSCIISRGKALDTVFGLYDMGVKMISPEFIIKEFEDNVSKISKHSGLDEESVLAFAVNLFSEFIQVVPMIEYKQFLQEAAKISPDKKDAPYFALSLAFNKTPIWSRELRLKRQKIVRVLSDDEIRGYFELNAP